MLRIFVPAPVSQEQVTHLPIQPYLLTRSTRTSRETKACASHVSSGSTTDYCTVVEPTGPQKSFPVISYVSVDSRAEIRYTNTPLNLFFLDNANVYLDMPCSWESRMISCQ
jgi:hypothetical protein